MTKAVDAVIRAARRSSAVIIMKAGSLFLMSVLRTVQSWYLVSQPVVCPFPAWPPVSERILVSVRRQASAWRQASS